jgi:hypothetical protein
MFKIKLNRLINEFGIKKNKLIELIESDRVDFGKKLKDNSFTDEEQKKILDIYGSLL